MAARVPTRGGRRAAWRRNAPLPALTLALLALVAPGPWAQESDGCRLVEATLQCLPGVDATPQQQIRILQAEIAADRQQEDMVEQTISGLRQVLLEGEAVEGELLQARLALEPGVSLDAVDYHWYRLAPGRSRWELIAAAQGDRYSPGRGDIAYEIRVVAVVSGPGGVQRSISAPAGPVRVRNPLGLPTGSP